MPTILTNPLVHPLRYRMLLFDADDTLRRCTVPGQPCPNRPDEWALLPNVVETLATYAGRYGARYAALVSNQGGVALGYLSWWTAHGLLEACAKAALPASLSHCVYLCPHLSSADCPCRKPSPLLLLKAIEVRQCSLAESLFVGDQESDREAAARAGVDFCWAADFFGWED